MKKLKIIFVIFTCFFLLISCKKKNNGILPSGKYIGIFVSDSLLKFNFTEEFMGFNDFSTHRFNLLCVSKLDSFQMNIYLEKTVNSTIIGKIYKNLSRYYLTCKQNTNNTISGTIQDSMGTFTLTYAP